MTWGDRRRRGFNQARLLAEGVGHDLHLPVRSLLVKAHRTPPQAGLPAAEREKNLRGAFRLVRSQTGRVLLVDDIYTTGSTVEESAHVLKRGECERVFVLTVARA
jgi:competence protein ComFC